LAELERLSLEKEPPVKYINIQERADRANIGACGDGYHAGNLEAHPHCTALSE
jgi:hypothetical protein